MEYFQTLNILVNTCVLVWLLRRTKLPRRNAHKILLDSCALIDGRIIDVIAIGFLSGDLIIPSFVLRELQLLADGKDAQKRSKARYGLEIAEKLQQMPQAHVSIDKSMTLNGKTDDLLIELANKRSASLLTTDYNLSKVAAVEGVHVLNLNELSLAFRPVILPGEEQTLRIIQEGDGAHQGVGYLPDGGMVVVYAASNFVGTEQRVIIERSLQTSSGRMYFAHLTMHDASAKRSPKSKPRR